MYHKSLVNTIKKSIKSKAKVTFNDQQTFFNQVNIDTIPLIIKQKIESININECNIIKLKTNPHGWVIAFYLSFLNVYFVDKKAFVENLQKMYDLLDEDEFKFFRTQNKMSYCYTQWTNSKIKRLIAQKMNQIKLGKYKTLLEIFSQNQQLNKLMFLFCSSMLYYCEKIQNYEQHIDLQTVKQTLFEYFGIECNVGDEMGKVVVGNGEVVIYSFHRTDLYMVVVGETKQKGLKQSVISLQEVNTNDEIRYSKISSIDSEPYDIKNQVIENFGFSNINKDNLLGKQNFNFNDLTNQKCNIHQYNSSINTYNNGCSKMTNSDGIECSVIDYCNKENYLQQQQRLSPNNPKNKIILSTQGTEWTVNNKQLNIQSQSQIDKLFEKKSHEATTQKSIYDDPLQGETPEEEYSFLDQNIPTSRRGNDRKTIRICNDGQEQQSKTKTENETLMNKWYDFIRERRNKSKNVQNVIKNDQKPQQRQSNLQQKLQISAKKILVQPTRLTSTQKPDFKKIKSRRRNTQKSQSQQKQLVSMNFLKSMKSQTNFKIQSNTNIPNPTFKVQITKPPRLSIQDQSSKQINEQQKYLLNTKSQLVTPTRMSVNENSSSYIGEFKVTQQFTNSVILDQINESNQSNIKLMKQKARKQRDSLGFKMKQRKTVK